jgi:hypothetical protein
VRTALSNARRDRITGLGVEVAFFAALALVPGLLVLVALLGSIEALIGQGLAERAEAVLLDLFRSILTEDAGDALAGVRRLFEEERPGLLTLGIASTLLALVRAFSTVFRALDVVYEVRVPRLWWQRRARAFALAVVTVIVAAVLLAVVVLRPLLGRGRQSPTPSASASPSRWCGRCSGTGHRRRAGGVGDAAVLRRRPAPELVAPGAARGGRRRRRLAGGVGGPEGVRRPRRPLQPRVRRARRGADPAPVALPAPLGLLFGGELNAALGGRGSRTSRTAVVT